MKSFQASAARIASIVGRRDGVNVVFEGNRACTDGKVIYLPSVPSGTAIKPGFEKVMEGYLDHEISHVRYTKWDDLIKKPTEVEKYIQNLLEDVRCENEMINYYPGTRDTLDALAFEVESKTESSPQQVLSLIYKEVWRFHRKFDAGFIKGELSDVKELGEVKRLIETTPLNSTRDVANLAVRIAALINQAIPGLENSLKNASGKVTLRMRDGKGQQPVTYNLRDLKKELQNLLESLDKQQLMEDLLGQLDRPDKNNKLESQEIKGKAVPNYGTMVLPPLSTEDDRVWVYDKENMVAYETTRQKMSAEVTAVKKMLNIWLRTRSAKAWTRGLTEGRLDTSRLHHLFSAETPAIMKELRERQTMETSVELLVDLSSSMNTELVRTVAIVLAEAMDMMPLLKFEISGFSGGRSCGSSRKGFGRTDQMNIFIFKGFREQYKQARARIGGITCKGCTPLGDAYGFALERMLERPERKKVLWILTDGEPAISFADPRHSEFLLMAQHAKSAARWGIQTVGMYLGGGENPLGPYTDKSYTVKAGNALINASVEMIKDLVK